MNNIPRMDNFDLWYYPIAPFAHGPPLSRDVLFTKSSRYRPARNFNKWSNV